MIFSGGKMSDAGGRIRALDGLRALAVALVVIDHATGRFEGGGVGVAVFFVLSGYLITGVLMDDVVRTGRLHLGMFYARRALRLWPALIVMLAVLTLAGAPLSSALLASTYTTDIANVFGHDAAPFGHTWSLGLEEQFYLLWPLLLPLALRSPSRATWGLGAATLASVLGCWLWTLHSLHTTGGIGLGVFNPLWQAHGILIGCALRLAGRYVRVAYPGVVALVGAVLITGIAVAASALTAHHWATWWDLAVELMTAVVIVALRCVDAGPFVWAPAPWLGRRSYAVYLWHLPTTVVMREHGIGHASVLGVVAALVAAELSARFVEAPFLRIKDRLHAAPGRHRVESVSAA